MGFASWLEGREGTKLIKPIIQVLSKSRHPGEVRMCVVARSDKISRRATHFVDTQSTGCEIVVRGFSGESMEEFIRTYMTARETSCARKARSPVQPWLSLPSLVNAVQDSKIAAMLEQLIQQRQSNSIAFLNIATVSQRTKP